MFEVKFLKEFQFSRRMQRIITRAKGETDEDYLHRVKIAKYGLEGEDRVNYQLKNINLPILCLSDVRIDEEYGSAQADFIVISNNNIFLLEVKNLFGSVKVTKDGNVIRIIPRSFGIEEEGMENPFTQIKNQAKVFAELLENNGFDFKIVTLIVMGNPRTAIYQENYNYPIYRYDYLVKYFEDNVDNYCDKKDYIKMMEVGEFICSRNKDRFFNNYETLKKNFVKNTKPLPNLSPEDLLLYEELLESRRYISKLKKLPICNVFLNRDAENLVLYKPTTKEEFIQVPGFKEKKYLLCGEEIIKIIKKYLQ